VLSLAMSTHLYRQEGDRFGAGRLTKVRAQAVSGRACRRVAERLGVPDRLREMARERARSGRGGQSAEELVRSERVLASITEAIIGACYLEFGFETTAPAVVEAFRGGGRTRERALQAGRRAGGRPRRDRGTRGRRVRTA
jgi:ribonuclease III